MTILTPTPCYLIDKAALQANLQQAARLRALSGARLLLALKCFATWPVFDSMCEYLDGTTSSSLFELKLGREKFGGETHAYSVAWADHEIAEAVGQADKIIFNSISQLERFAGQAAGIPRGLRLNPQISASGFDLADPARPYSRLGESDATRIEAVIGQLDGFMIHNNCENRDYARFDELLTHLEERYGHLLQQVSWVSLGGGIHFTAPGYPLEALGERLRRFAERHGVQVYLEPGEAVVQGSATLEVTVLDTLYNGKHLAIVDSSTEAHMLDLLIYRQPARIEPNAGPHRYMICGKTCLAGDIFGEYDFPAPLEVGARLSIQDAAGYTMVKKNWFNGIRMPAIAVRELDGQVRVVREFDYPEYVASLG
ncbi:Carboxynorspermidine/carboxyspermidine decarboxylase [Sterolibacterium denitrificans]|uniref:Carboxynorspermidine/carboxyspermidine decarboxylase n=1 Tax=Sterolibacterium denitrificans TaxID=157592 RepID=A0A7Z7HS82_9PROT|nr:carboxynorspermidine decarboxylase [Sterolibacterium denitrificans]SMB28463.1 Carboxynorspermidine/carboxyspermidine decarboxylase [Sterolibacterium denitrificans]